MNQNGDFCIDWKKNFSMFGVGALQLSTFWGKVVDASFGEEEPGYLHFDFTGS